MRKLLSCHSFQLLTLCLQCQFLEVTQFSFFWSFGVSFFDLIYLFPQLPIEGNYFYIGTRNRLLLHSNQKYILDSPKTQLEFTQNLGIMYQLGYNQRSRTLFRVEHMQLSHNISIKYLMIEFFQIILLRVFQTILLFQYFSLLQSFLCVQTTIPLQFQKVTHVYPS